MSHLNSVNSAPQNVNLSSEDLPIAAEWVTTSEEDDSRPLMGFRRLLPPTESETTGEELQATDAIAFNFLQIPPSSPSRPTLEEDEPALRPWRKLSPTLVSGLACLIVANGLLVWHQGTSPINAPSAVTPMPPAPLQPSLATTTTAATAPQKLTLANLSELPPPAPPSKNLPGHPALAASNSLNSVKPTAKPLTAYQAIAELTPPSVPAYQAIEALDPSPAQVRNALSELLLPPSLQPQMVYSTALPPGSPDGPRTAPAFPAIAVRPPQPKPLPPTSTYQAALQPQGTVSLPERIVPPPPPLSVNPAPLPAAPPTFPPAVPVAAQTATPSYPNTTAQTSGYTTDQMLRQTLNQQNQMEIEAYQQANTPFNQKVKQKLQPLMPQIQSIQSGETPPPGDTQGLVEQLQRLNQAE